MADEPRRVAVTEPLTQAEVDLFGRFTHLCPITVEGHEFLVPEHNSVLRALQYVELKTGRIKMAWGKYCWNNTEGCCEMTFRCAGAKEPRTGRACIVEAEAGLEVLKLPAGGRVVDE